MGAVIFFTSMTMLVGLMCGKWLVRLGFPLPSHNRVESLDGLRGFLAVSVLCHHVYVWSRFSVVGWREPDMALASQLGTGAVGLFFMITGYLFYRTILNLTLFKWAKMMVGRIFRILPLVTVSFVLIVGLVILRVHPSLKLSQLLLAAVHWITAHQEVPILGYAEAGRINAYVLWSLWQEWLFYAVMVPVLGSAAWGLQRVKVPTLALPIILILLGFLLQRHVQSAIYWPLFGGGMLAYEIKSRDAIAWKLRTPGAAVLAVALLAFAVVTTRSPYGLSLPAFAFFFACVACGNAFGGVLTLKAARALGECSFGIYLLHGIVLSVAFTDLGIAASLAVAPFAVVIVVAVSAAAFLLVERPMDRVGHAVRSEALPALRRSVAIA